MDWKGMEGKQVFIRTKHDKFYNGKISSVDVSPSLIWISLLDKFGDKIILVHSEIVEIKEEL